MSLFLQDAAFEIGNECGEWHNASQESDNPIRYFLRGVNGGPRTEVFPNQARLDEISARAAELESLANSQSYKINRKKEYDKLNQFELMFDDKENQTTTWQDAINAIKSQYPKG